MGKYFGTDGIRGVAGENLDAGLAFRIGQAAGTVLAKNDGKKPRVIIARDTRISCDMLESALTAGLCSAGADVTLLGVLPTPAAAYLTIKTQADMGVVISASHNPFEHNGIKMFGADGFKLSDALEESIEELIDAGSGNGNSNGNGNGKPAGGEPRGNGNGKPAGGEPRGNGSRFLNKTGGELGRITRDLGFWTNVYVRYLAGISTGGRYGGRIAIDCANGAATETARLLFRQLDAEFEIIFDEPNGVNINVSCGSTQPAFLCGTMKTGRFGIGFAFDGDADRCIAVDESGRVIDGDMLLAVLARHMQSSGTLKGGGFVGTVVSNSGMEVFADNCGLVFHRADVGDRNVLERMRATGCNIGGESSGHLIFTDDATTGDGQMTAVKVLNMLSQTGKTLSELVRDIPRFPQVMPSYRLTGGTGQRDAIMEHPRLLGEIEKYKERLAGQGRILIRPSGTEPIIRVLVEAKTEHYAAKIAKHFIDLMKTL